MFKYLAIICTLSALGGCGSDSDSSTSSLASNASSAENTVTYEANKVSSSDLNLSDSICTYSFPKEFSYKIDGNKLKELGKSAVYQRQGAADITNPILGVWAATSTSGPIEKVVYLTFEAAAIKVDLSCSDVTDDALR